MALTTYHGTHLALTDARLNCYCRYYGIQVLPLTQAPFQQVLFICPTPNKYRQLHLLPV